MFLCYSYSRETIKGFDCCKLVTIWFMTSNPHKVIIHHANNDAFILRKECVCIISVSMRSKNLLLTGSFCKDCIWTTDSFLLKVNSFQKLKSGCPLETSVNPLWLVRGLSVMLLNTTRGLFCEQSHKAALTQAGAILAAKNGRSSLKCPAETASESCGTWRCFFLCWLGWCGCYDTEYPLK